MFYESHLYDGFLLLHNLNISGYVYQISFNKNLPVTDKLNQLQNNSLQKVNPTNTYSVQDSDLLHNRKSYKEIRGMTGSINPPT